MLTSAWRETWASLGLVPPGTAFDDLLARYAQPQRHYHTLQHLEECLAALRALADCVARRGEAELALWFHDAVHDPQARDNEARSAALASDVLRRAGAADEVVTRVCELVLATRHDTPHCGGDAAPVVDADLSILAADDARFDEYECQVRREYAWLDGAAFNMGRARVLGRLLEREWIYCTPRFRERCEARARRNLRRSLARLRREGARRG